MKGDKFVILPQIILYVVHYSSACQSSWILNTNDLEDGNVITFKNTTIIGKTEILSWIWSGYNSNHWENKVSHSLENGDMEGSLLYKSTRHGEKTQVSLSWNLEGKQFSWVNADKEIFNSQWVLRICDGINMKFTSNKDGSWEFKVDDYFIRSNNGSNNQNKFDDYKNSIVRKRRSEEEFDETFKNTTETDARGIFDCIYDFFFGEGDATTGRNEGVFTRMKNWIHNIACRLRGNCDGEIPSEMPYLPPITLPPSNPDSESFTENIPNTSENSV